MTRATPTSLRFFAVVQRPPASTAMVAGIVVAYAVYLAHTYAEAAHETLAIALFLQLFAASTGYRDRLRRGHFDAILVSRPRRVAVAWAHWLISIGPGLATWLVLAAIALAAQPHQWPAPLTLPWIVAFFYASTMAWAASLALPRLAGGALWSAALFALGGSGGLSKLAEIFRQGSGTWPAAVHQAAAALICPFLLVGVGVPAGTRALAIIGGVTVVVGGIGLAMIARFDGPLVDPS